MATILELKVVPSSGQQRLKYSKNGVLTCYLKSPPEKGKANKELVKFLAKKLTITQGDVAIIGGQTTRNKRIKIDIEISETEILEHLGIQKQMKLF